MQLYQMSLPNKFGLLKEEISELGIRLHNSHRI